MIERLIYLANHYGLENQLKKLSEESIEYALAIVHKDKENVIEELADICNVLVQVLLLLPDEEFEKVLKVMEEKQKRQLKRLGE